MQKYSILTLLLTLFVSAQCYSADWPGFRGIDGKGISSEKILNTNWNTNPPKLLWKIDMTDDGYSGPSVVKGKLYIIDHVGEEDVVRCLDVKTGIEKWRYKYPNPGKPDFGFTRATPAVSKSYVVTLSRKGLVVCLNAQTGKHIWTRDTLADFPGNLTSWGHGASVLIDSNKVIVTPGGKDACVVALDLTTGKTIWKGGGSDTTAWTTPAIATINGKRQYVVLTSTLLTSVDAQNGQIIWQYEYKTQNAGNIASPIVIGNKVFVTASYNMGCAMIEIAKDNTPTLLWKNKNMQAHMNTPVYIGGYIYGISDPENLVCLDSSDGSVKWIQGGFEKGPVLVVGNHILALAGDSGQMALIQLDPTKYTELGRFTPLGGQSWSPPVYTDGKLLVRNQKNLACYSVQ